MSEVFFLFRLYDYDRSGLLDGLEMMKLLSDFNSHHTPGVRTNELVRRSGYSVFVFELILFSCLLVHTDTFILFGLFI